MWILAIAALAAGLWYYEAHKSPAAATGRPVLDANMPKAAQDALIAMVAAQTDPAELDKAAALLASAPPPGPYPLAAQWVAQQAAALRAKQQKTGMGSPAGHTPVTIPSHNGARPPVDFKHPAILAHLYLQALQNAPKAPGPSASMSAPPAPSLNLSLKGGKALMDIAWANLMKNGFEAAAWAVPPTYQYAQNLNAPPYYQPGGDEGIDPTVLAWRNFYILGNLEEPTIMADPDARTFWQTLAAGNPFFAKGTAASKALGWG